MDLLLATISGTTAGMLIGLLPGVGTTTILILLFPFLIKQSTIFCILFYCVASSVSQYFGSVTTLTLGVPGENTSLPLFSIRKKIVESGQILETHFLCAAGSFIASALSIFLICISMEFFHTHTFYLKTYIVLFLALLGLCFCVRYSNNSIAVNILFVGVGWACGKIGYNEISNESFLTFDNVYLYSGIPILPAMLGIYAIPNLYFMVSKLKKSNSFTSYEKSFSKLGSVCKQWRVIISSSFIGFVSGLIPYIGNGISSNLAFAVEQALDKTNYIKQATAAETANNAANLSVLIPLLILGVAIVPSEFVLLEIINSSNSVVNYLSVLENFSVLMICILLANVFSFLLSWNLLTVLNNLVTSMNVTIPWLLFVVTVSTIYYCGQEISQSEFWILILFVFAIIGFVFYNYDMLPFVYGFLLQNSVEQIFYRFWQIYII